MTSNFSFVVRMKCRASSIDDPHPRIVDDVVVLLRRSTVRHALRDQRLDLADHDALDVRVRHERAGRDAGAEADDQHRLGLRVAAAPGMWPSMRCSRMSCGSLDASTLPATWKFRTPFDSSETAIDEFMPSPT